MEMLPQKLANGVWFRPKVIFWNVGVNHEGIFAFYNICFSFFLASLAASIGNLSLEEEINRNALRQTVEHTLLLNSSDRENTGLVDQLLADLQQTV